MEDENLENLTPFLLMSELLGQKEKMTFLSSEFFIQLTKDLDSVGEIETILIEISRTNNMRNAEWYMIDETGVWDAGYQYPPLIQVPFRATLCSADLTEQEKQSHAQLRAEKIAEFIRNFLKNRHIKV